MSPSDKWSKGSSDNNKNIKTEMKPRIRGENVLTHVYNSRLAWDTVERPERVNLRSRRRIIQMAEVNLDLNPFRDQNSDDFENTEECEVDAR